MRKIVALILCLPGALACFGELDGTGSATGKDSGANPDDGLGVGVVSDDPGPGQAGSEDSEDDVPLDGGDEPASEPIDSGDSSDGGSGGALCDPCERSRDCEGVDNLCLVNNTSGERFCGRDCSGGKSCPSGYECLALEGSSEQCTPISRSCESGSPTPLDPAEEPAHEEPSDMAPPAEEPAVEEPPVEEPAPEPMPGTCSGTVEQRLLQITNEERQRHGLSPLVCDENLTRAAWLHSVDMCENNYFSHTGLDGSSPSDRARAQGVSFRRIGENIARGQRSPEAVHSAWMDSPGHRSNILGSGWGRIGIGYDYCGNRPLWTQMFVN